MHLTIDEFITYIDEERTRWEHWFSVNGNEPLRFTLAGETHPNVGALILHCFWTELWYASMLRGEMLTHDSKIVKENSNLPSDQAAAIFAFGRLAHERMRASNNSLSPEDWARIYEFEGRGLRIRGSVRKLALNALVHEVRHWAQIAMVMRQHNLAPPGEHDFIFSNSLE